MESISGMNKGHSCRSPSWRIWTLHYFSPLSPNAVRTDFLLEIIWTHTALDNHRQAKCHLLFWIRHYWMGHQPDFLHSSVIVDGSRLCHCNLPSRHPHSLETGFSEVSSYTHSATSWQRHPVISEHTLDSQCGLLLKTEIKTKGG